MQKTGIEKRKKKQKKHFHDCHLRNSLGENVLVCKTLFLATLNIGRDQFIRWCDSVSRTNSSTSLVGEVAESNDGTDVVATDANQAVPNRSKSKRSRRDSRRADVADWLESIPKVPSHYCRASMKKSYVDSTFRSSSNIHSVYSEYITAKGLLPVSRQVFVEVMKEKNIDIHSPRKDQCDICTQFNVSSVSRVEYDLHVVMKNEARQAKNEAKGLCCAEKVVITMDLQSVLLAPKIAASAAYYKMKLQVHNFSL